MRRVGMLMGLAEPIHSRSAMYEHCPANFSSTSPTRSSNEAARVHCDHMRCNNRWANDERGQPAGRVPHVGILDPGWAGSFGDTEYWSAFRTEMEGLGYRDGATIALDYRWAQGDARRLPGLAEELTNIPVQVIVAASTPCIIAAKSVSSAVPIVSPQMADPLGSGFAESLARPGGNVTGLTTLSSYLSAKRLQLLKETVPSLTRAAWCGTGISSLSGSPSNRARPVRELSACRSRSAG